MIKTLINRAFLLLFAVSVLCFMYYFAQFVPIGKIKPLTDCAVEYSRDPSGCSLYNTLVTRGNNLVMGVRMLSIVIAVIVMGIIGLYINKIKKKE